MMGTGWIDSHVHMDDARFTDAQNERLSARQVGVTQLVIPAIGPVNFQAVRNLAQAWGDGYALGIHPMYLPWNADAALAALEKELEQHQKDPHLVAIGEIGLDFFEERLRLPEMRALQQYYFMAQLRLAQRFNLPVILHVRRSVDAVWKCLRSVPPPGGIAHAFIGSLQQAQQGIALGLKLGFGGAMTFERATRLRELACSLPMHSIVLETDAPDIAPRWIYVLAHERHSGILPVNNSPKELPRIGQTLAALRTMAPEEIRDATTANVHAALPKLALLCKG